MYSLLNRCIRELFTNPNLKNAIDVTLSHIGEHLRASSAYVILMEADGGCSVAYEWCGMDTLPMKALPHLLLLEKNFSRWLDEMKRDGFIIVSDIGALRSSQCAEDDCLEVKALECYPIWKGDELCGYMELHHCHDCHRRLEEEARALQDITGLIAVTLGRMWLQDEIAALNKARDNVLKSTDTLIYVSDLKTNKISYANAKLQRLHNGNPLTGRVCWEALQNHSERCAFCPISYLRKNPGEIFQWEFYNKAMGRHFRLQDSIISWVGGRTAHLEYAVDITEIKRVSGSTSLKSLK